MTIREWLKTKLFGKSGIAKSATGKPDDDRLTFINDNDALMRMRIREYNIWYCGDGDELLNYYTHNNMIDANYEPFYLRNKKSYFWAISSTEGDIKRTHSGQPRNIVDTLVGICRFPTISSKVTGDGNNIVDHNLRKIIEEGRLKDLYRQEQLPLTLVEGWGCYKINWDKDISDYPYATYYRADCVDFIYKANRVVSVVFKDYYTSADGKNYMLAETRSIKSRPAVGETAGSEERERYLAIEYNLFLLGAGDSDVTAAKEIDLKSIDKFADLKDLEVSNCNMLLAVPCVLFSDTSKIGGFGRSIFTGKIDLFDDLDQCLSQASESVRKSTPIEYFNSDYLERDAKTGMPIPPHAYDRKYTVIQGQPNADGASTGVAVQVTQPKLDFAQYSDQATQILLQIINGIMSPATLGIDIAKKDNAEAQREKEKVTIFTRNCIIDSEALILKTLCSQLLCAKELMNTGKITVHDYDISVKFSEFADSSFENKLEKLGAALDAQCMSEEMYMAKLYDDTLAPDEYEREKRWLIEHHTKPRDEGMLGIAGGGENLPGMFGTPTAENEQNGEIGAEIG